jgi:hypothetical protein
MYVSICLSYILIIHLYTYYICNLYIYIYISNSCIHYVLISFLFIFLLLALNSKIPSQFFLLQFISPSPIFHSFESFSLNSIHSVPQSQGLCKPTCYFRVVNLDTGVLVFIYFTLTEDSNG